MPLRPPVPPMLARLTRTLPTRGYLYEPKWDGFRALAFREGERVELQSRNLNPFGRYFPELTEALLSLSERQFVMDGEIVILGSGGFEFGALLNRVHPAPSRVERLRLETPASFVAFDLLAQGDESLLRIPFAERRRRLQRLLQRVKPPLLLTPVTDDAAVATTWLDRFTGRGVDGVVVKAPDLLYQPGRRAMLKVKPQRTADCVVAGVRMAAADEVASLLLGLYDATGHLRHIGVASSFSGELRRELFQRLRRLTGPLAGHPWEHGFGIESRPMGRLRGAAGIWTPVLGQDWVPVRPDLVCEVAYDQLDLDRLRHPARFRRWRPDRDPQSCSFEQFEAESPATLIPAEARPVRLADIRE